MSGVGLESGAASGAANAGCSVGGWADRFGWRGCCFGFCVHPLKLAAELAFTELDGDFSDYGSRMVRDDVGVGRGSIC